MPTGDVESRVWWDATHSHYDAIGEREIDLRPSNEGTRQPMTDFKFAHAAADDWEEAAKACVDGLGKVPPTAGLGFVYATDTLVEDLASIVSHLKQNTGIEDWVGCVGMGICAGTSEYFDRPALAAMVATIPGEAYRVFSSPGEGEGPVAAGDRAWIERAAPPFGIVHADPTNAQTPGLIDGLALATSGFLVGGLTSSRGAHAQVAGHITDGGISGVLFAPEVEVATGLSQGCTPLAESHIVSDCIDEVIIGLDGERALDVLKRDVGELLARDLNRVAGYVHVAFPIAGSDTADYVVRNLVGIDSARGWLAVGGRPEAGDRILFVRRDPKSARLDLARMLRGLKGRLSGAPRGGVYFSCIARGPNMFGAPGAEMSLIHDAFGDIPIVGFYCAGEISNNRLYGYTGVLALFL